VEIDLKKSLSNRAGYIYSRSIKQKREKERKKTARRIYRKQEIGKKGMKKE